jgi:hypothetical protein
LRQFRSETGIRSLMTVAALLVIPACLALLLTGKKPGLMDQRAIENALLARHLAQGDGFATSAFYPLTTPPDSTATVQPDTVHPPAYPLLLSLVFRFFPPAAHTVTATGFILWLLTGWLLFLIARAWWDNWVAIGALIFYCANTGLIVVTGDGLPQPFLGLCLLGVWWFGFPPPRPAAATTLPAWRLLVTGLLCGVTTLTDYLFLPVALVPAVYYGLSQPRRGRAVALFAAGFLALLLPWWIRNLIVAGGRPWGWFPYEALTLTGQFPGRSVWLLTAAPVHPAVYFLNHPLELFSRILAGLLQLRSAVAGLDPVVLFLFALSLFTTAAGSRRKAMALTVTSAMLLVLALALVVRPDPWLLLAWWPLVAAIAAAQLVAWTTTALAEKKLAALAVPALAIGLVLLPLLPVLLRRPATIDAKYREAYGALGAQLPATGILVTDTPAQAAWFLGRPTLALPQVEADLDRLTAQRGGMAGIYLQAPTISMADW